ncbi:hypothetical protein BDW71DRAFT_209174 [Aspergillus fruticulosus]
MTRVMNVITDKPVSKNDALDHRGAEMESGYVEGDWLRIFDDGVVNSDIAISPELQFALTEAVSPLEDVLEDQRDHHPASDGKVIDLMYSWLFPVVYGRTRVLPDRVIGLDAYLKSIRQGTLLPAPSE